MASALRYQVIRKIADGGSAEVFLAEQHGAAGFRRPVVLKRLRAELCADINYRQILLEEAQLAMSLHHPNLVEVFDLGESTGRQFLVMELVDGWTLHHVLRRSREEGLPLPPEVAVYIAAELCRGLSYAHERVEGGRPLGIVHRDVCPNNVLLSTHAEVKLIDFGIARARNRPAHTGMGRTKGKPAWMSPEQARAEPLDARSDVFSVGSVLFAMLTGEPPFTASDDLEVISRVSRGRLTSSAKPPAQLRAVVQRAMAKDPDERFQSAQEFLHALEAVQRAGRPELDEYLRALSRRDGDTGILNPPAERPAAKDLELSKESASVTKLLASPPAPRPSRWRAVGLFAVLLGLLPFLPLPAQRGTANSRLEGKEGRGEGRGEGRAEGPPSPLVAQVEDPAPPAPPAWTEWDDYPVPLPKLDPVREPLKVSARLAPRGKKSKKTVAVLLESQPTGLVIKSGSRELGRTPTTLHLRNGRVYDLAFVAKGQAQVRQRLLLTPRAGKQPKVTLRTP
ncbi:MAG: serine/threonine-protein kinase [Archangium sp.]|nr:serine/threonine-protein kinase [Archangium sp.]